VIDIEVFIQSPCFQSKWCDGTRMH